MRIDIAAHVGHWPFRPFPETCRSLLSRMDATQVTTAVVSNLNGLFYQNPENANAELATWLADDAEARRRLIPFAVINPTYPGWRDDASACLKQRAFAGVRLYPQYHDYTLADPALAELFRWAEDEQTAVAFSLRMIDARGRSWLDTKVVEAETEQLRLEAIAGVLKQFPLLRCIILQSIFEQLSPATEEFLRNARVLFDTTRATTCGVAGPNSYDWWKESRRFGEAKFAFGSMAPFTDDLSPILRLSARPMSKEQAAAVWGGNARKFLKLP